MFDQWNNEVTMVAGREVIYDYRVLNSPQSDLAPMFSVLAPYLMEIWEPPSGRSVRSASVTERAATCSHWDIYLF